MSNITHASTAFTQAAASAKAEGVAALRHALSDAFRDDLDATVARVSAVLAAMGLPLPARGAIVAGAAGVLIPLDHYGVMLRIEQSDAKLAVGQRVNTHPMVLQPLGQRPLTDGAVLEICVGCHLTATESDASLLAATLSQTGVNFWDDGVTNIGLLPFVTPEYPKGVPVVIDRLAVEVLAGGVVPVRIALDAFKLAEDMQARYQPLRQAFTDAWPAWADLPDKDSFRHFKEMCEAYKARGELVTGWAHGRNVNADGSFEENKARNVAQAGRVYAAQMQQRGTP